VQAISREEIKEEKFLKSFGGLKKLLTFAAR